MKRKFFYFAVRTRICSARTKWDYLIGGSSGVWLLCDCSRSGETTLGQTL